jgi:hypothetical protein
MTVWLYHTIAWFYHTFFFHAVLITKKFFRDINGSLEEGFNVSLLVDKEDTVAYI